MIQATNGPATKIGPKPGMTKKSGSEQHPPDTTPEGGLLAPIFHSVTGVVVSDDLLVDMIILADDGHLFHIESRLLEFLHSFLCLRVGSVNGYKRVRFRPDLRSFHSVGIIYRDPSIVQGVSMPL